MTSCDAPSLDAAPDSPVMAELVTGLVSRICTGAARSGPPAAGHIVAETVKRRLTAEGGKIMSAVGNKTLQTLIFDTWSSLII